MEFRCIQTSLNGSHCKCKLWLDPSCGSFLRCYCGDESPHTSWMVNKGEGHGGKPPPQFSALLEVQYLRSDPHTYWALQGWILPWLPLTHPTHKVCQPLHAISGLLGLLAMYISAIKLLLAAYRVGKIVEGCQTGPHNACNHLEPGCHGGQASGDKRHCRNGWIWVVSPSCACCSHLCGNAGPESARHSCSWAARLKSSTP